MSSDDTPKTNIKLNLSIIDALEQRTESVAPSPEVLQSESLILNYQNEVPNLPNLQVAVYGGPQEAKQVINDGLAQIAKNLDPNVSEESLVVIKNFVEKSQRGSGSALPLICNGMACPFLHVCSLHQAKIPLPVGSRCPLEVSLVSLWVNKHLKALGISDIDAPENSFDMDMLYELATQELIRYRCSAYLSKNPNIVESKMVSESFNGTPIFADVMNPVLEAMDKAGRNISKIREALLATRKSQVNAGQVILDNTERAAALREKARNLNKLRESKESIKDADYRVKDEPN